MYNVILRHVRESLLPWKSKKYHIFVCLCVLACVHPCGWVGDQALGRVHVHMCSLTYAACSGYAPYCDIVCGPLWLCHVF